MPDPQELVSGYFDNTLTDEQFSALVDWIRADEASATQFVRASWDHSNLRDVYQGEDVQAFAEDSQSDGLEVLTGMDPVGSDSIAAMLQEELEAEKRRAEGASARDASHSISYGISNRPEYDNRERRPEPIVIPWGVVYAFGTAAAVAVVLLTRAVWPNASPEQQVVQAPAAVEPQMVATIIHSVDAMWSNPTLPASNGVQLPAGPISLASGFVELEFAGGARIVVEAPAELELLSFDRINLDTGKIVGNVPRQAVGFTVKTPSAAIVDLGTEFGIVAREDRVSEVHVLDGVVEVVPGGETMKANGAANSRLLAGSALEVDDHGAVVPIAARIAEFYRRVPRIVSAQEEVPVSFDARLVDSDGDGKGDRVDFLDGPSTDSDEDSGGDTVQVKIGVGERNGPKVPDSTERRYWMSFEFDASRFGKIPDARMIDSVHLALTLDAKANVSRLRVDVQGLASSGATADKSEFEEPGELLAAGAIDLNTPQGLPTMVDVTDFVKQQLRNGKSTFAFRLQAVGDRVPNHDGVHNSYVFHTSQAPHASLAPRLNVSLRKYESVGAGSL